MNFAGAKTRVTHLAGPVLETCVGRIVKQLLRESTEDDVSGLAAAMAYRMLLALFPFFIFLGAVAGFVADIAGMKNPTQEIMKQIGTALPGDARSILQTQLHAILDNYDVRLLSLGAIGSMWGATAAMSTLVKALNRAYDVEESRPYVKRTLLELGLTTLLVLFLLASFVVLLAGQLFASEIGSAFGLSGFAASAFTLLRFPIVFVLMTTATAFIYWAAPAVKTPFKWVSPGAVFFILSWILATVAFSYYVSNFGAYQTTYGTLGGVIVLLVWLYLTSYLMMMGAELNAILQANAAPEKIRGGQIATGHKGTVARRRRQARAGR